MLPIPNISYLSPVCCIFFFFFYRKMHNQSQNWLGVQYPLNIIDSCMINKIFTMVSKLYPIMRMDVT